METQYGWKCPQCSAIYGPFVEKCAGCSTPKPAITASAGTITFGNSSFVNGVFGTVFCGPPVKSEAVQAEEAVSAWQEKGFGVKTLIAAALDTLIEDEDDDEDDEDD